MIINKPTCGCCTGIEKSAPSVIYNRPGLSSLNYRVGDYASFLDTMLARLSNLCLGSEQECKAGLGAYPLQKLTSRSPDDFAIALLHGWATVADVLTFYQERLANEGYLRTATERRSVLELARLIGYQPRPGVSASVFLAYTLDNNFTEQALIGKGTRAQSIPGPGELPQSFETSEDLPARAVWNNLKPRLSQPQNIKLDQALTVATIYLENTALQLKPNDPLLLIFGDASGEKILRRVLEAKTSFDLGRTDVTLQNTPFLIVTAVALLRATLAQLDKLLSESTLNQTTQTLALLGVLDTLRKILRRSLENFCLGNYPPLDENYFNHDRIYAYLRSMRRNTLSKLVSVIIRRTFLGSATVATINATAPPRPDTTGIWLLESLLDQALTLLQSTELKRKLVCLATYILQQTLPTGPGERKILQALLRFIPLIVLLMSFVQQPNSGNDLLNNLRSKTIKLLLELSSFLRYPPLRKNLVDLLKALIDELPDDSKNQQEFLKMAIAWVKTFDNQSETIQCAPTPLAVTSLEDLLAPLLQLPSVPPAHSTRLARNLNLAFSKNADAIPRIITRFQPRLEDSLYSAWANARVDTDSPALLSVYALGLTAPLFGYNAQTKMAFFKNHDRDTMEEMPFVAGLDGDWKPREAGDEENNRLYLDNAYENILPGIPLVIHDHAKGIVMALQAETVTVRPRTAYGISGKTTQISLSRDWWRQSQKSLRKTAVSVATTKLALAPEPVLVDIAGDSIELSQLYDGLVSGRWAIVEGERSNADIPGTSNVRSTELVMIAGIEQVYDKRLPGDTTHTRIRLAGKLAYSYKRDTVKIYGNVVKATHGETRQETLGSGNGARPLQAFTLKQQPLTFVSAANPAGVDSTLKVLVNGIEWHESKSLNTLTPASRSFISKTDDEGKTTVIFGNGYQGARLPTGIENIKAAYRNGIGKSGNVKAGQISLLVSRPGGVKEVINPLRASGGADKESRDQARKNAPLTVAALDRLVSVQDYQDFSRTYAGIGKACAREVSDKRRQIVHVTVAGTDDSPIDESSDLFINLRKALHDSGDPLQPVQLAVRELVLLVISAKVKINADYQWELVVASVRTALLDAFGFERRELGQDVGLAEVISVMQGVAGVLYIDIEAFGGLPEKDEQRQPLTPGQIADRIQKIAGQKPLSQCLQVNLAESKDGAIRPAQMAFLTPEVPDSLILNQIL